MDFQNTDLRGGSLQISTEVIGKIARCAALEIDGVAEAQNSKLIIQNSINGIFFIQTGNCDGPRHCQHHHHQRRQDCC